ncbi:MAG: ATP-binding protein [Sandaracinaceae bacterium]
MGREPSSRRAEPPFEDPEASSERVRSAPSHAAELLELAEAVGDVGYFSLDLTDGTLRWSPALYRIHGLDPATFTPALDEVLHLVHPDEREELCHQLDQALDGTAPFEGETRVRRPDGEERQVRLWAQTSGDGSALLGVVQDFTELERLWDRLYWAEKMAAVGTMAAGVAHEVNNPLTYLESNAELLAEELPALAASAPPAKLEELLSAVAEIREGTQRIHEIVHGLKSFSRVSSGEVEEVDLATVLQAATRLCRNAVRHRAQLVFEVDPETPSVQANESRLVQVAVNLLMNAAQAVPEGRMDEHTIRVACGRLATGQAFFEVSDTGAGMDEDVLEKAFSPFFTTKPKDVGTGLGLAICKGIVTNLGGSIEATSRVAEGTTMRVVLPVDGPARASRPARVPLEEPEGPPIARPADVLLLDDEPLVARSLARLLRPHRVQIEQDPREALDRLQRGEAFDVIVCDLMMPTMSGRQFYESVGSARPELQSRMLFVTGGAFTPEGREFVASIDVPVLEKPVDLAALRRAMADMVEAGASEDPFR